MKLTSSGLPRYEDRRTALPSRSSRVCSPMRRPTAAWLARTAASTFSAVVVATASGPVCCAGAADAAGTEQPTAMASAHAPLARTTRRCRSGRSERTIVAADIGSWPSSRGDGRVRSSPARARRSIDAGGGQQHAELYQRGQKRADRRRAARRSGKRTSIEREIEATAERTAEVDPSGAEEHRQQGRQNERHDA